jgi:hypothetical protein
MVSELFHRSDSRDSFDIFETRIDGEFHGWWGNTLFAFVNGQIWQQCSYDLLRHYAHSPSVVIYRSGASVKMKVEGIDQAISVTRIK